MHVSLRPSLRATPWLSACLILASCLPSLMIYAKPGTKHSILARNPVSFTRVNELLSGQRHAVYKPAYVLYNCGVSALNAPGVSVWLSGCLVKPSVLSVRVHLRLTGMCVPQPSSLVLGSTPTPRRRHGLGSVAGPGCPLGVCTLNLIPRASLTGHGCFSDSCCPRRDRRFPHTVWYVKALMFRGGALCCPGHSVCVHD